MMHIPAHKNLTHPPGQIVNPIPEDKLTVYEARGGKPKPYLIKRPRKKRRETISST